MAGKDSVFIKLGTLIAFGSLLLGIGGGLAGASFFAGGLKTQDSAFEKALVEHKAQQQSEYAEIQKALTDLQRSVGRIEGKLDGHMGADKR